MWAMSKLNGKFSICAAHLGNALPDTTQNNMITPYFRVNQLTKANVLLRSVFLTDLSLPAKILNTANKGRLTSNCAICKYIFPVHKT